MVVIIILDKDFYRFSNYNLLGRGLGIARKDLIKAREFLSFLDQGWGRG